MNGSRWSVEAADPRIHGTADERSLDCFAREQLTALGSRLSYRYERVRLVALGGGVLRRYRSGGPSVLLSEDQKRGG